jgi:hypothetical protein
MRTGLVIAAEALPGCSHPPIVAIFSGLPRSAAGPPAPRYRGKGSGWSALAA